MGARRFSSRRGAAPLAGHPPGRWSLTAPLFAAGAGIDPRRRRRAQAELLLERYGILTRELVLAEGVPGGFSALYPELCQLETLGVARRGYFVEGLGGAQFALAGRRRAPARAARAADEAPARRPGGHRPRAALRCGPAVARRQRSPPRAAPTAEPLRGGALKSSPRRPARAAGAHVVLVDFAPVLYLERGGRALQVLTSAGR